MGKAQTDRHTVAAHDTVLLASMHGKGADTQTYCGGARYKAYLLRCMGKARTSRIVSTSARSMTMRSMPMPQPTVGGRPYSMLVQNPSSGKLASSSPSFRACWCRQGCQGTGLRPRCATEWEAVAQDAQVSLLMACCAGFDCLTSSCWANLLRCSSGSFNSVVASEVTRCERIDDEAVCVASHRAS